MEYRFPFNDELFSEFQAQSKPKDKGKVCRPARCVQIEGLIRAQGRATDGDAPPERVPMAVVEEEEYVAPGLNERVQPIIF